MIRSGLQPPAPGSVVLVTGASTGLGLALARKLIALPYRVILTARESSLPRFAREGIHESEHVWIRALDVTNQSQRIHVVQDADERLGGIDVLINNAGVAYRSVVEHARDVERQEQFDINFHGPLALARLVLPQMRVMRRRRPPLRVSGTRDAHFFYLLRRFLPRSLYHAILYRGLPGIESWGRSGESGSAGTDERGGE